MSSNPNSSSPAVSVAAATVISNLVGVAGVIYCRTATVQPGTAGVVAQERACRDYLRVIGIDDSGYVALHDHGVSGQAVSATLELVLEQMRSGKIRTLVVTEVSRIARSDAALGFFRNVLRHGGRVIVAHQDIDTRSGDWAGGVRLAGDCHTAASLRTADLVRRGQVMTLEAGPE